MSFMFQMCENMRNTEPLGRDHHITVQAKFELHFSIYTLAKIRPDCIFELSTESNIPFIRSTEGSISSSLLNSPGKSKCNLLRTNLFYIKDCLTDLMAGYAR
jgi:hypothetical protein